MDSIPISFKEIIPDYNAALKWREIILNTGGTHSTLQDIKLPQRGGGYCYETKKACTRNRFIYWQTTADSVELSEASLDVNLSGAHLRCKVAAGTPPLDVSAWEHGRELVVLVATVSSVHRLHFPHPSVDDETTTFLGQSSADSIFHDATTSGANNTSNYFILPQYSNSNSSVAHTCSSWLHPNGEALWVFVWGRAGDSGLLLVRLPAAGAGHPSVHHLKRESTVPRFLSGLTGALRGRSGGETPETCAAVISHDLVVAVCADACLRVWGADDPGAPLAVSRPLADAPQRPAHAQGHKIQKSVSSDGGLVVVVFLCFPSECEFVVVKVQRDRTNSVRFTTICKLYGPQLELVDYQVGGGEESAIWALWSRPDGDTFITTSALDARVSWQGVAARPAPAPLPVLASHQQYRDTILAPGLLSAPVVTKALVIYRRTYCGGEAPAPAGGDGDVRSAALAAVQARLKLLLARPNAAFTPAHLMHRCWADLYSWCVQYMEGLQKPLGLVVSKDESSRWCGVVRRGGLSFVRPLSPLERLWLAPDPSDVDAQCGLDEAARRVLAAGARWERWLGPAADDVECKLFSVTTPQHRLLPRLLHLMAAPAEDDSPTLSPQNVDDLTSDLEQIEDLQKAVLELNEVLRLDVPDLDLPDEEMSDDGEYETLFGSGLGVSVLTEAIRQMAELRGRMVRGVVGALGAALGAQGVPGAGHCLVHWQAYRTLLHLRSTATHPQQGASDELFRLKLSVLGLEGTSPAALGAGGLVGGYAAHLATQGALGELLRLKLSVLGVEGTSPAAVEAVGVVEGYAAGAGGGRARRYLAAARAPTAWHAALPLAAHHLAYQMWAVSGGFEFGWWLATINQPKLVQNYVALLEPWCEWNACSRQLILGLARLDSGDPEGAYAALCKAAKGVASEPFLQRLVAGPDNNPPPTQHRALVVYYLKVIKLFEIHDAGACVVRLAETAISIADKDDPNLAMFQWLVFKWHLSGGRIERALSAAAANPSPQARASAAATLITALASRKQLSALVGCAALAGEAERAATSRAKLHPAHTHNPYYSFLYALHVSRSHYRRAAMVMYERAARCAGEPGGRRWRRRCLVAALTCLRLAQPQHAFLTCPVQGEGGSVLAVVGPDDVAKELRELDAQHPETRHNVDTLLPEGDNIDFEELRQKLSGSDAAALHAVAARLLSAGLFLPHWLLAQYMETDSGGCVRTLLGAGRVVEAAAALADRVRHALRTGMTAAHAAPACLPLAAVDRVRHELRSSDDPACKQICQELEQVINEYVNVVQRTSEDMKLARIQYPVAT